MVNKYRTNFCITIYHTLLDFLLFQYEVKKYTAEYQISDQIFAGFLHIFPFPENLLRHRGGPFYKRLSIAQLWYVCTPVLPQGWHGQAVL